MATVKTKRNGDLKIERVIAGTYRTSAFSFRGNRLFAVIARRGSEWVADARYCDADVRASNEFGILAIENTKRDCIAELIARLGG